MLKPLKIAVAESCTGGLLGHLITQAPGSSGYFLGGVIAYDDRIKRALLGVSEKDLKKYGAVSETVARQMARGVRRRFRSSVGIALTGIAGPGGGSKAKPVGLVYIALDKGGKTRCRAFHFKGSRSTVKSKAAKKALGLLRAFLR